MTTRERTWWGWGYEDRRIDPAPLAAGVVEQLGFGRTEVEDAVAVEAVAVAPPRVDSPWPAAPRDRLRHSLGSSYLDAIRGFRGRVEHVVDAVARPRDEAEVEAVLEWSRDANAAVIPYGGGTSGLDRVLEVDPVSRSARIQAGASGPVLEEQLGAHGQTMRFFPQSFELSTLGGWIATRAGGHFATLWTHVDDLVESVRAVTPVGAWESRRLPGSGAGPSPDRMLLGSEGALGVITEAWVRVQPRPPHRASRAVRFAGFLEGAEAVRALAQSGLHPSNVRLIDALEAQGTGAGDGTHAVLVLGFESTDHPVEDALARGLALCREHGGVPDEPHQGGGGAVGAWRDAFIALPYLRDALLRLGVLSDTVESAITWERLPAFHAAVTGAVRDALGEPCRVTCRLTHAYPDGAAPYVTVIAPAARGEEEARWWAMKRAASEAILAAGGTITHHHAVGRDHREFYDRQRPDPFAAALAGAKAAVDPHGLLNPGVLLDAG
jgi:alkyldihydroxyacetonephosphate synthase